jgi:GAF domain-containing protein
MSQGKRKYKRIEAFFSRVRLVAPNSPSRAAAEAIPPAAASPAGGWQDILNRIDRGQRVGFTYDQETFTSLEEAPLPLPENSIGVPLTVSGTTIGTLQVAGDEAGWTSQETEILSIVAAQLAQHLEHLRILEQDKKSHP